MLVRRRTLEQIGLLPEEYFFGVEDVDYSLCALKHRIRIVVARKATVWHKVSSTAGPSMDVSGIGYHVHKGWQILRRKYLSTPGYFLSSLYGSARAAILALAILLRHIAHGDFRQSADLLRDMAGSLTGLVAGLLSRKRVG
jgi:GT2 family glycosyltransferase